MSSHNWYAEQHSTNCDQWVERFLEFSKGIQLFFKGAQRSVSGYIPVVNIGHSEDRSIRLTYSSGYIKRPFDAHVLVAPVSKLMQDFPSQTEVTKRDMQDLITARTKALQRHETSEGLCLTLTDLHRQLIAFASRKDLQEFATKHEINKKKSRERANRKRFKEREDSSIKSAALFMLAFDLDYNPDFARHLLKTGVNRLDNIIQFLIKNRATIKYIDDARFEEAIKQCQVHRVLNT